MINQQRLADEFARLAAINSPPLRERAISVYLADRLQSLGGKVFFDDAAEKTGGEVGNLVARFSANGRNCEPLLFSVHMDTVEPDGQVVPKLEDGVFTSAGETILGADDKAGIAEVIEMLEVLREQAIPHGEIEVVVTIAEEIGLVGAKNFDYNLVNSRRGYALDTPEINWMVLKAPGANRMKVEILGREAHAGVAPEQGVSAIQTAGLALANMRLGRIDHETTANFGRIEGGVACNIIPLRVFLEGEARSHDADKLQSQTEHLVACFVEAADAMAREIDGQLVRPEITVEIQPDYPRMAVDEEAGVVALARRASEAAGHDLKIRIGGGGSDANMFNAHGIEMIILATGMQNVHTVAENVSVADMAHVTELLLEIVKQA